MMDNFLDKSIAVFKEEAAELLTELENSLLELEQRPDDQEIIARVFRAMHTIKGSGGICGFDRVMKFTHEVETVFDLVRNGKIPVTKELIDLTLQSRDQIRLMLDNFGTNETFDEREADSLVMAFRKLIPETENSENKNNSVEVSEAGTTDTTYRIRVTPSKDIFIDGTNLLLLLKELCALGESRIVAQMDKIPGLDEINPEYCYSYWDVILTTGKKVEAVKEVFVFAEDKCSLKIDVVDKSNLYTEKTEYKKVGEILVERGDISGDALDKVISSQKKLGEILINEHMIDPNHVEAALVEQKYVRDKREKRKMVEEVASIRVPSHKLDGFVDRVGELVIVQARLHQTAVRINDPDLISISEEVDRLTSELRESAMSIRLVPIGTTFSKFNRLVRDLAGDLGREIEMVTTGGQTELDKTVIERLSDPLVHLIRNSIDHGIESPDVREAAGKPRKGTIHLFAEHSGGSVLIRISDDGAGIDTTAVKNKAIEKGLIKGNEDLNDKDIFSFIFNPGFSTAKEVSSVSGRGVGMDVVKKNIESLRGTIEVDSQKGAGTTITLKLPLTMAIIEGLQVKIENEHYVIPLSIIEECIELTREKIKMAHGRHTVNLRGSMVPYISLREWFNLPGNSPEIEQIVVTRINGQRMGFVVDHVIGEHQTVIKGLGKFYRQAEGISGATIRGDGSVALIIDPPKLLQAVGSDLIRQTEKQ